MWTNLSSINLVIPNGSIIKNNLTRIASFVSFFLRQEKWLLHCSNEQCNVS
jgi:hypothetical protein